MPYKDLNARRLYHKEYARNHPDLNRGWRIKNKDHVKEMSKQYYNSNKERYKQYSNKWRHTHSLEIKTKLKYRHLKIKYNLTKEQWQQLLITQNYRCAICSISIDIKPCVDHCHKTGRIRGLLCDSCNIGLGKFKDTIDIMEKAIKYLKEN